MDHLCHVCYKTFSTKSNLHRHLLIHGIVSEPNGDCERMQFNNFSDFLNWKEVIEKETCSSYVKMRGQVCKPNGDVHIYYDCCRTGVYKPRGKGVRKLKSQHSAKIGGKCPARIHVKIRRGKVFVQYFDKHDKHSPQLEHLRVPKEARILIAEKLKNGVPIQRILDDIREESAVDKNIHRILLIDRRDIYNIKRDFKIVHDDVKQRYILPKVEDEMVHKYESDLVYEEEDNVVHEENYIVHKQENYIINEKRYIGHEEEIGVHEKNILYEDEIAVVREEEVGTVDEEIIVAHEEERDVVYEEEVGVMHEDVIDIEVIDVAHEEEIGILQEERTSGSEYEPLVHLEVIDHTVDCLQIAPSSTNICTSATDKAKTFISLYEKCILSDTDNEQIHKMLDSLVNICYRNICSISQISKP